MADQLYGKDHPNWKGGRITANGYVMIHAPEHPKAEAKGYVYEHVLIAEKALGKHLPDKAVVHHHTPEQLVICQDQGYHLFLHQRMRAFKACGQVHWRKCVRCKKYDDPEKLTFNGDKIFHKACENEYRQKRRKECLIKG